MLRRFSFGCYGGRQSFKITVCAEEGLNAVKACLEAPLRKASVLRDVSWAVPAFGPATLSSASERTDSMGD